MEGGYYNYVPGADANRKIIIDTMETDEREAEIITRGDIPKYLSTENKSVLQQYAMTAKYGLPFGSGWANQPAIVMDIIWALDNEDALIRSRSKHGGNR